MLKILISNDDGYDSPGLEVLFEHLKEVADLFVVAPEINNSGAGCSITTNRPFDFTQKNFSMVKLKFLIDTLLYFFKQADSECLILQKK